MTIILAIKCKDKKYILHNLKPSIIMIEVRNSSINEKVKHENKKNHKTNS